MGAIKKLDDSGLFEGFERILEIWRDGRGVDFVIATEVNTLVRSVKEHGLDVTQQGVIRALNSDTPRNANKRLKACIEAAAKAATKTG